MAEISEISDKQLALFSRQMLMPNVGIEGQEKLLNATVLIVGAGGLGCSVAQYLHGSGVGKLIVVDDDVVELSNLPRQIVFRESDVGKSKAEILCKALQSRFDDVVCVAVNQRFSADCYATLSEQYAFDVLIDCGDNLPLTWLLGGLASDNGLPLVHASVSRNEGHLYRYLPRAEFPPPGKLFPATAETETCSQSGVLSATVGVIASLQAHHVVSLLLAADKGNIKPELLLFDGQSSRLMPITVK